MIKTGKIDILFVLPSLRSGGAERVMSFLAQNLDSSIFNTSLLITGSDKDQKYQVSNIPVTFLNKVRVQNAIPSIVNYLIKNNPNIVISAIGHLNAVIGLIGLGFPKIKFVARATTIPGFKMKGEARSNRIQSLFYRLALRFLDKIICQSNDMKSALMKNHGISESRIVVINNPVTSSFKLKKRRFAEDKIYKMITIGRLTKRKGYKRVLKVLAKFDKPFHYTIIGSGDNKSKIIETINALNLKERVTLIPYTDKVWEFLNQSDIYLQGSYVEGFPNALLESCATGTPAVVYNAPGGINEIIIPGLNGYIAKNPAEFLDKLIVSTDHDWNPEAIRKSVYSRYSEEMIISKYKKFFLELSN